MNNYFESKSETTSKFSGLLINFVTIGEESMLLLPYKYTTQDLFPRDEQK
jgi:hypothetical protein